MLNFDFLTLSKFLEENIGFLLNSRIQKIQQPTRQEFIFTLRNSGETRKFYVNINPQFFHICFMSKENEEKRLLKIPQSPPMFCMLLRKYLEGSKIAKVVQPDKERILEFYFQNFDETGEKIYLCLAVELMGKYSNIILYNYDTNIILGCAHNVGSEKSRQRELFGGLPYVYPLKNKLNNFDSLLAIFKDTKPVNEQIDTYFATLQEKDKIRAIKSKLFSHTKSRLKKTNSTIEKINRQSPSFEKINLYRKKGDLIMSNLYSNNDYVKQIELKDYETNSMLKIELDETKTLKENANKFYKLYNKGKIANEKTKEMIEQLNIERDYLEQILYSIENSESISDLLEIEEELFPEKKDKKKKEKITLQTIFEAPYTIYVGKNNKQNDYIISKLAKNEDIWFHTHNIAGSHVLLKCESGAKITDEIIFKCAKLAKENSSAKLSSKVGVIYTKAKNLRKPPAANLGYVTYKGEKEIIID